MPTVSVIIPCFQQANFLGDALGSLRCQSLKVDEIIVVDDGSPDDVASAVSEYRDLPIRLIRKSNYGLPAARNTGILASTGEFLVWLDSDDYLPVQFIERMVSTFESSQADVCYCDYNHVGQDGELIRTFQAFVPSAPIDSAHQYLLGNMFPPHAAMTRRTALANSGLFDPLLRSLEDWDLWLRLAFSGARYHRVDDLVVPYRQHPESMSKNASRMRCCAMEVLRKSERFHKDCRVCKRNIRASKWAQRSHFLRLNGGVFVSDCAEDPLLMFASMRQYFRNFKWKLISSMRKNP